MVKYFLERIFEGIEEYWVNTKFSLIFTSFKSENTRQINKALVFLCAITQLRAELHFKHEILNSLK
jgi:hypothetical protein